MLTEKIKKRIEKIKILMLDVDGVLTDGMVNILGDGKEMYVFNVYDGYGVKLFRRAGFKVGFITGRISDAVEERAKQLEVDFLYRGASDKVAIINRLAKQEGISMDEICFMGDDLQDLTLLKDVGLSVSPSNAREEVKKAVHHVTKLRGGDGAVRELVEFILKNRGLWKEIVGHERILS